MIRLRRRKTAPIKQSVLEERLLKLADDLDQGRLAYTFVGDITAAMRGLLDEAVV